MIIFLAGMESISLEDVIETKVIRNAFYSYYYLRGERKTLTEALVKGGEHIKNIIIDSGAHSFFSENEGMSAAGAAKKKTKTKESPEEFFQEYKKWVKKYFSFFDYFVELDIGELVGQENVLRWREELKKEGLYSKCITVYHPKVMTWADFLKTLDDSQSGYVAFEGERNGTRAVPYGKALKECYTRGIKVHGFAMTKTDIYFTTPLYSVDSSSWKASMRYGVGQAITTKGVRNVKMRSLKDALSIQGKGISQAYLFNHPDKRIQRQARLISAAESFNQIEDRTEELWKKRGIDWAKQIKLWKSRNTPQSNSR